MSISEIISMIGEITVKMFIITLMLPVFYYACKNLLKNENAKTHLIINIVIILLLLGTYRSIKHLLITSAFLFEIIECIYICSFLITVLMLFVCVLILTTQNSEPKEGEK